MYSGKIFTLQKKIVRIVGGAQPRTSCRNLFKQLEILPVPCHYILSLMNLLLIIMKFFQTNSTVHNINTRHELIFMDQMPTYLVFKKVHSMLA